MLILFLYTCMNKGIKKCIIGGDLMATDQAALNSWLVTWRDGNETQYEADLETMHGILRVFVQWFDLIVIIEGNHDDRIARKTGGEVHLGMFLERYENVFYSRYPDLYIATRRGYVHVIHPGNYSKNPAKLAQDFYNIERGPYYPDQFHKAHIVLFHCHYTESGMSLDGVFECHGVGMMRDETRTQYVHKRAQKNRKWNGGFFLIQQGHQHNLGLMNTNWQQWLGEYWEISPFVNNYNGDMLKEVSLPGKNMK